MQIAKKGYDKLSLFYAFSFFIAGIFVLFYALYKSHEAYKGIVIIFSVAFFVFGFFHLFLDSTRVLQAPLCIFLA